MRFSSNISSMHKHTCSLIPACCQAKQSPSHSYILWLMPCVLAVTLMSDPAWRRVAGLRRRGPCVRSPIEPQASGACCLDSAAAGPGLHPAATCSSTANRSSMAPNCES